MGIPRNLFRHRTAESADTSVRKQPEVTEPVKLPDDDMNNLIHDVIKTPAPQESLHTRNKAILGRQANHANELHLLGAGNHAPKKTRTRRAHAPKPPKLPVEPSLDPTLSVAEASRQRYKETHDDAATGELQREISQLKESVKTLQETVAKLLAMGTSHVGESGPAFRHELFGQWWRDHQGLFGTSAFSSRWKGNGVAFAIGLQHGVYEALGDDKKDDMRNLNRRHIIAGSVGLLTMGGIGALRQDLPAREQLVSTEALARHLTIEGLEGAVQQSIIDEAQRRIGEALLRDLSEQELHEYQAIIDGDQAVIDAWLSGHAPAYKTSLLFQEFESGVESDPDHTPADKAFAATAWIQEKVLGIAERTQLAVIDYKKEVLSLRHA